MSVRRLVPLLTVALTAALGAAVPGVAAATGSSRVAHPPTPHEPAAIEAFAAYQPQFFCRSTVEPGVAAFEKLALTAYPATHSDGDMRGCHVGGTSEHKDGRAFDWGADHRVAKQRAAGKAMLRWLFATDANGNHDAMFRRLGLMYIIWNHRIWGSWDQTWEPYSCAGDATSCHVDHMHFSFGWAGAEQKTSYWTHHVAGTVEPPLPRLTRGHRTLSVSARSGEAQAHWLLARGATYRVTATGTWHRGKGARTLADAVCARGAHGWAPAGAVSLSGDQLAGWGLQWVPTHDTGGGCNTATHTYRLVLHQDAASTVSASLADSSRGDDSGTVRVRFTRTG